MTTTKDERKSIKDEIKENEFADWIKCTLGLHRTCTALHVYVMEIIDKFTHKRDHTSPLNFTQDEYDHIVSGTGCIRNNLISPNKAKENYDRNAQRHQWEWKNKCTTCRGAFQKIMSLDTGESRLYLGNCNNTGNITLEWAIAKMFMPKGNEDNTGPEDTDPAAFLSVMLRCNLFLNATRKSHKEKLIHARNSLYHSPDNKVNKTDKKKYFKHMIGLLKDASNDNETDYTTKNTIDKDLKEIEKLDESEVSVTLYDDALKEKRRGIHNDFERCLSKFDDENDIEQLRKLLELAEQVGADIQALTEERKSQERYKSDIERIKVALTETGEEIRDVSRKVQSELDNFKSEEMQSAIHKITCFATATLKDDKDITNHLLIVIVVGTILFALMFRVWVSN